MTRGLWARIGDEERRCRLEWSATEGVSLHHGTWPSMAMCPTLLGNSSSPASEDPSEHVVRNDALHADEEHEGKGRKQTGAVSAADEHGPVGADPDAAGSGAGRRSGINHARLAARNVDECFAVVCRPDRTDYPGTARGTAGGVGGVGSAAPRAWAPASALRHAVWFNHASPLVGRPVSTARGTTSTYGGQLPQPTAVRAGTQAGWVGRRGRQ